MSDLTAIELASTWLEKWEDENPRRVPIEEIGNDLDLGLPRNDPALCLATILELLSRIPADPTDRHFQLLAAGPLEDLLSTHGESMIEEIDSLARRNPPFRLLLNGVWQSSFNETLQARLSKYRSNPW